MSLVVAAATLAGPQPAKQLASKARGTDAAGRTAEARLALGGSHMNGHPAQSLALEGPTLTLRNESFEGTTGCNSFSGTSIVQAGCFFANSPMATERGCGTLTAQEEAIFRLLH